jgi:uncharacterized protein (DUF697 family)
VRHRIIGFSGDDVVADSSVAEFGCLADALESDATAVFDADFAAASEQSLIRAIHTAVETCRGSRIALARAVPAVRDEVVKSQIQEVARQNARTSALSALPGAVPFIGTWLDALAAPSDLVILTRRQVEMVLTVAACYGVDPVPLERLREVATVLGGGYGMRAIARQIVGFAPGGVGVAAKAAIAYAGTVTIGRTAARYYRSGGNALHGKDVAALYTEMLRNAIVRFKGLDLSHFRTRTNQS